MSEEYNPLNHSVIQACYGNWEKFEADDFFDALFMAILEEIKRVHWNVYQHQWEPSWHGDEVRDPEIEGIAFVRYYQDLCDCGWDEDGDENHKGNCIGLRPNFEFDGVKVSWYKWPGRGMSTNKDWSPAEWKDWFDKCMTHVRAFERSRHDYRLTKAEENRVRKAFYEKYKHVHGVRDLTR